MSSSVIRRIALATLSFVGIVGAHSLAFSVVEPDPHRRLELLHTTGHDGYVLVVATALGILAGALAWRRAGREGTWGTWALRLSLLQVAGFTGLELAERTLAGHVETSLWTEKVFYIGLALQVIVAIAGAWLVRAARRALERTLDRVFTDAPRVAELLPLSSEPARVTPAPIRSGWSLRGPPVEAF